MVAYLILVRWFHAMFLVMLFLAMLVLGIAAAVVASVALSFTPKRHSWIVLISALPGFAVGAFYTGGFFLARRPFSPWFVIFWLLLFFGGLSITRWFYKRP